MLDIISKWKDKLLGYVATQVRIAQLSFIERVSGLMSYFIFAIILIFIVFGVFLFLGFGVAELFTAMVNSRIGGFFLAAACYVLLAGILIALRKKILKRLSDVFINVLTEKQGDDEDEEKGSVK